MFNERDLERILKQPGYSTTDYEARPTYPAAAVDEWYVPKGPSAWESEWHYQAACIRETDFLCNIHPKAGLIYANANGMVRRGKKADPGIRAGVPDLMLPVARLGYHGLYLELKVYGGKVKPDQIAWAVDLRKEGYCCKIIIEDLQAYVDVVLWYLGGEGG